VSQVPRETLTERERQSALLRRLVFAAIALIVLGVVGIIAGQALSGISILMGLIALGFAAYLRRLVSQRRL
jgi:hypothetical protein